MRSTLLILLTCTALVFGAGAQERTIVNPASRADATLQKNLAGSLQTDIGALKTETTTNCTDGGVSHAPGTTWVDACPVDPNVHGSGMTRVCVKGVMATLNNNCFTESPCGTHHSGDTWAGSCPSGTTGNLMYRCSDGVTLIDNAQTSCAIRNCNGKAYSVACPDPSADGIPMTGTMSFQCVYNSNSQQSMKMTGNTCRTYNKPCGNIPNGGSATYSCASLGGFQYSGNLTLACSNGATTIAGWSCYIKSNHMFTASFPGKTCGTSPASNGNSGYGPEIDQSCTVTTADLPGEIRKQLGLPDDTPLTGMNVSFAIRNGNTSSVSLPDSASCAGSGNCANTGTTNVGGNACSTSYCGSDVGGFGADKCINKNSVSSSYNISYQLTYGHGNTLGITASRNGGCGMSPYSLTTGVNGFTVTGLAYY